MTCSNASSPRAGSGKADRVGRRADVGLGVEQFVQPLGRAGGAQQVAIDFGQRAERAGEQPAVKHERGDRAAGHAARGDVDRALPDDHRDRAEHQEDDDRGHDRAQQDAPLGGREDALDRVGEARRLAPLLVERLDDLHRAEHFAGDRADVGDAVLAAGRDRAHAAAEEDDRPDDQRHAEQHQTGELGREREQDDDAADAHDDVAQRDRDGRADNLLDDRRVDRDAAR